MTSLTTGGPHPVQVERMLPHQIQAAIAARSVVYLPLGSIEYHSHHLPLGLDGLTAHGICTRAATASDGVVLPTLWFGTGGTHTAYPWTIMTPTAAPLNELAVATLGRLSDLGVQLCVLFSGHFADEQLTLIDRVAADWNAIGARPRVLPLAVNRRGPDPRTADLHQSQHLLDQVVDWVCRQVTSHEPTVPP
jgi:creatinine amidohydrolase